MRLFLYGALLHGKELALRGGDARLPARCVPAELTGWRRVALVHDPRYPTLCRARTAVVQGQMVAVPAHALARLTAWEGPDYRLTRVVVRTPRGKTAAHAWIAAGNRRPWDANGARHHAAATAGAPRHARG